MDLQVMLVSVKNKTMVKYDYDVLYILSSFICGLPWNKGKEFCKWVIMNAKYSKSGGDYIWSGRGGGQCVLVSKLWFFNVSSSYNIKKYNNKSHLLLTPVVLFVNWKW